MNLLYANDRRGHYPESWYAASVEPLPPCPPLRGETRADVVVVGGGYTGLSAALHAAEKGLKVILLEAQRVGFGASGRNGGQLGSGQRVEQDALERMLGVDTARHLWDLGEAAKALVRDLIARHEIDCHYRDGVAHACFTEKEAAHEHAYAEHLVKHYGYDRVQPLDRAGFQAMCPSPAYVGGSLDHGAGHLHPLAFALGLARAALKAGVTIHEGTEVHRITQGSPAVVHTDKGRVVADHVIIGTNGYGTGLNRKLAAKVMPINNFIAATEPLGAEAAKVLTQDVAVCDTKFVINYFKLSHDGRLLFGGGESYGYKFPADVKEKPRKPMLEIFPHLKDARIDYAWGGTLAITMKRLPYMARLAPNVLAASGYSGHGVGTATHAGQLMAEAIAGEASGFDTLAQIPAQSFPGGGALRTPLLAMAMTWFALRDRLGV